MELGDNLLDDLSIFLSFLADIILPVFANIITILAGGLALFIFYVSRKSIASVFDLLINYSYRITLTELNYKLESLSNYNMNEPSEADEIMNILHEVIGQIKGNETLSSELNDFVEKIEVYCAGTKNLTEPRKRGIVSELRERLRNLDIRSIEARSGEGR